MPPESTSSGFSWLLDLNILHALQALLSILMVLYVRSQQLKEAEHQTDVLTLDALSWTSVRSSLLRGCDLDMIWLLSKLGLPGGFMTAMEAGSFDLTTALAGTLGVIQVDAHVAMLSIISFNFMSFPFGISIAATIRCALQAPCTSAGRL
jgi:hypothetical protein